MTNFPFEGIPFTADKREIIEYFCKRGLFCHIPDYKATKDPMFSNGIDRFLWLSFCLAYCSYNTKSDLINTKSFIVYSRINKLGDALILNNISKKFIIKICKLSINPHIFEQDQDYMCKFIQSPEDYKLIRVDMNPKIPPDEDWPLFIGYPILEEFFKERIKE